MSTLSWTLAENELANGDLLLFRKGKSPISNAIAKAGGGVYSHAAMAGLWDDDWLCLEVREWYGGRITLLKRYVCEYPSLIDVYKVSKNLRLYSDLSLAVGYMRSLSGCRYGWRSLLKTAIRHLPLMRWFAPTPTEDGSFNSSKNPPYCSQAVAQAYAAGIGLDVVPNLSDRVTEPSDLARSALFSYAFTLTP